MLTGLTIRHFKRFEDVYIDLANNVVFVGPNNSGKTTALQALALWDIGIRKWQEKRGGKKAPSKRTGVTINRRDLLAVPVPSAKLLWQDLHVRESDKSDNKQTTQNIRIEIIVNGVKNSTSWECGLEFDYANEESLYCRPLRTSNGNKNDQMPIPEESYGINLAFLPPMSGLAATEIRYDAGAINVLIGEGRTAEVLRNLCFQIIQKNDGAELWHKLTGKIQQLFGVSINEPKYIAERGELVMDYRDQNNVLLDISSTGRGLQQTILLLAHLYANPETVLLLDEPDAHLEILRQREIYQVLTDIASEQGSQIIAASHSEVILNEAAERDVVIAFLGSPHRIDDRGSQVLKSLKHIGYEHYYLAEQKGFVLYLEGSTDLAILRAFANKLDHDALIVLACPFVHYLGNQPTEVEKHFYGLKEAKNDLVGFALFDRIDKDLQKSSHLQGYQWKRKEIECYLCQREILLAYAVNFGENQGGELFGDTARNYMNEVIDDLEQALEKLGKDSPWSPDMKVSDEFLPVVFKNFSEKNNLPDLMSKSNYHELVKFVPVDSISSEVVEVLDMIVEMSSRAKPRID